MITIIVDTEDEFDAITKMASSYVCGHLTIMECCEYPSGNCEECYCDNHIKCGIRVIPPCNIPKRKVVIPPIDICKDDELK